MMAQVINTICDHHLQDDVQVAARTYYVALRMPGGRVQEWEVDLCDDDAKALAVVHDFLVSVGRSPGKAARQPKTPARPVLPGPVSTDGPQRNSPHNPVPAARDGSPVADRTCPADDCAFVSSSVQGLTSHAKSAHGTTLAALRGEPLDFTCGECDQAFSTPQGLGAHRRSVHGVVGESARAARERAAS